MYRFSGSAGSNYIVIRLSIDLVPQKHTVSLTGNTAAHAGNFGLWQGSFKAGAQKVSLDYRATTKTVKTVSPDIPWERL